MDGRLIIGSERLETGERIVSENPATLEPLGEVSVASKEICARAVAAAKAAYPAWRWLDPREKRAAWFADRLEAGSVTVNAHMYSFVEPRAIWGGIKQTGMGRSHGPYGLHELVNIKHVGTDFFRKKAQTWWFPYDASLSAIMEGAVTIFHSGRLRSKMRAVLALRKEWRRIAATAPLLNYVRALPRILKK